MKHETIIAVAFALAGATLWAEDAKGAVPIDGSYCIVVPSEGQGGVVKALKQAGKELADAFNEGAGLKLKVVGDKSFKGGRAIFLGAEAAEKAGLMPADLKDFANAIAEKDGSIYLFGRDAQRRVDAKSAAWTQCLLPTVKAVTRFMERFMDVRFLAPGEVGKDIPAISGVKVPKGLFDRHLPPLDYAPGRYDTMLYDYVANSYGSGRYHSYGGHTYPSACRPELYFKDHPEYYGLVGGKRTCKPERNPTLCISNPAVEDLLVKELLARMDEGSETVQLAQQDGGQWCECEACKAYGGAEATTVGEKLWILHRRVAERIVKLRPGKRVNIICYGPTIDPPKTFRKFPENVMIEVCHPTEQLMQKWKGYEVPHGFVSYIYLWGNYPTMGFTAKRSYMFCAEFVRMLRRNNVHGIYRCGFGELFGMEGPAYYVFNRMIDDPAADTDAIVQEYCDRAYGPAAAPMREFHDCLDRRLRGINRLEAAGAGALTPAERNLLPAKPKNPMDLLAYAYSPDTVRKMEACLRQAEALAATPKQRTRLALVRSEFDYAANMGRVAMLYGAYMFSPSVHTLTALGEAVDARNAILDGIYGSRKPNALPKRFPGWPGIRYFGAQERRIVERNGRLSATLGAPLNWDVKAMLAAGVLPGATRATLDVARVEEVPAFGDFESGAWAQATWAQMRGIQAETPGLAARFKLLAGPDALYLAAESEVPPDAAIKGFEHDGPCWREENFSMMVSPKDDPAFFYHLIWNVSDSSHYDAALGLITDPLDPKYKTCDPAWNGAWTTKSEYAGGKWRTLLALPYATVGAKRPMPGEAWGFNIGRDARHTGKSADKIFTLWNPNFESATSISNPNSMGTIRFK